MQLALKIDVDTYRGIAEGASRLAAYLHAEHIPASLFVTMGPDTSGRAAWRVFRHPGFFKKMRRTSAIAVYGWRTVLSGTLWPARPMAISFVDQLRQWRAWGFEVSPHGYDHIRWHDQAAAWDEPRARQELEKISETYQHVFGDPPQSFAAPGWQAGAGTWQAMERLGLLYHSDSRGDCPYFVQAAGRALQTLEIPTTLPTWDEMLAWDGVTSEHLVDRTWGLLRPDQLNVWTIHAEFEGTVYFEHFRRVVERTKQEKVEWVFLPQVAQRLTTPPGQAPVCDFAQDTRPGRAGTVTCQRLNG
ncbi:MAG: polysaccharide deacetylase family protein [Elusimicrobiota bacterium]|jgi:peptidoglycan/xylan/chitin deacetylase (PgdA/CDA1 family)